MGCFYFVVCCLLFKDVLSQEQLKSAASLLGEVQAPGPRARSIPCLLLGLPKTKYPHPTSRQGPVRGENCPLTLFPLVSRNSFPDGIVQEGSHVHSVAFMLCFPFSAINSLILNMRKLGIWFLFHPNRPCHTCPYHLLALGGQAAFLLTPLRMWQCV